MQSSQQINPNEINKEQTVKDTKYMLALWLPVVTQYITPKQSRTALNFWFIFTYYSYKYAIEEGIYIKTYKMILKMLTSKEVCGVVTTLDYK